jgi:cysteinyl-tRNA synthetase
MRLFDSKEQALREFTPLTPGRVSMYVCGPTVQSSPHVGHLRSALVYDQLRRWLTHEGLHVTLIRNVTDIDDKVLDNAAASGTEEWWALAYRMEAEFTAAYDLLGISRPSYEPRATGSVPEMLALISLLIEREHAYAATNSAGELTGDVFFDTTSFAEYGSLTNQGADALESEADSAIVGKRHPRDFALWKSRKLHEPESASWMSPWGQGRPGWHIECSAMATKYLGTEFDIHGGGLDLRFPHHENELAQSAAAGHAFARFWLHNGLVSVGGQKMSKSLGNSVYAADLQAQAQPLVLRYFLGSAHYRSTLELHDTALAEAAAAFDRIETFISRAVREGWIAPLDPSTPSARAGDVPAEFRAAMNDDLNVPGALAVVFDTVRAGNTAFDAGNLADGCEHASSVSAMLSVLGINPLAPEWQAQAADGHPATAALSALMPGLLAARQEARAAKDFVTADRLRDTFAAAGITIEDTPTGVHWSLDG